MSSYSRHDDAKTLRKKCLANVFESNLERNRAVRKSVIGVVESCLPANYYCRCADFNDTHTHEEVLAVMNKAIKKATPRKKVLK